MDRAATPKIGFVRSGGTACVDRADAVMATGTGRARFHVRGAAVAPAVEGDSTNIARRNSAGLRKLPIAIVVTGGDAIRVEDRGRRVSYASA